MNKKNSTLNIIERERISKETEVMLIKDEVYDQTIYQVSICITRLEEPYYSNQLYRIFADQEQALEFYENLCEMRGQDDEDE